MFMPFILFGVWIGFLSALVTLWMGYPFLVALGVYSSLGVLTVLVAICVEEVLTSQACDADEDCETVPHQTS